MKHHPWLSVALTAFVVCAVSSPCCRAQSIDPAKEKEIRQMLELTGSSKMAQQMMDQMLDSMKGRKSLSSESIERIKKKLNCDELMEMIIPIYDKYYSTDDLKAVNAFYSSQAGQKLLKSMPLVLKDSMKAGQEWGAKIGKKIADEIEAEDKTK